MAIVATGAVVACSSSSSDGNSLNGSTAGDHSAAAGQQYGTSLDCAKCHTAAMSGSLTPLGGYDATVKLYPPNLTPDDDTGIGKWTDEQLKGAIIDGIDNNSEKLCPQMNHYPDMSDDEAAAIIAWLRSLPAVHQVVPGSICPPLKG
jgi:mono/diheme cytochrome c family protein